MRRIVSFIILLLCFLTNNDLKANADKLDPFAKFILTIGNSKGYKLAPGILAGNNPELENLNKIAVFEYNGLELYSGVFVEMKFDDVSFLKKYGTVTAYKYPYATIRLPVKNIDELAKLDCVKKIWGFKRVQPIMDSVIRVIRAKELHKRNIKGKDVVIGIVDFGIDYFHKDFRNADGTTKIKYLFDPNDYVGPHPDGFNFGTEWTEEDINRTLRGENIVRYKSDDTHGTLVAGSAAASGFAFVEGKEPGPLPGVAPESDIIFCELEGGTHPFELFSYIVKKAEELRKPVVINCSWGSILHPHDGSDDISRAVNIFSGKGLPGVVIVAGAGNNYGAHSTDTLNNFDKSIIRFTGIGEADGIYCIKPVDDVIDISLRLPDGEILGPINEQWNYYDESKQIYWEYIEEFGKNYAEFFMALTGNKYSNRDTFNLIFESEEVSKGVIHLWTQGLNILDKVDRWYKIISPSIADGAISAGAFISKSKWIDIDGKVQGDGSTVGNLAGFSSWGPRIDGKIKPDITAPGQVVFSAKPSWGYFWTGLITPDNLHTGSSGTSFSGPIVSGSIALILSAVPWLDKEEILNLLIATAIKDSFVDRVPGPKWGYGKIDIFSAYVKALTFINDPLSISKIPAVFEFRIYPESKYITFEFELLKKSRIQCNLYNLAGQKIYSIIDENFDMGHNKFIWNIAEEIKSGAYFIIVKSDGKLETSGKVLITR